MSYTDYGRALLRRSAPNTLAVLTTSRSGATGRLVRFWGCGDHQREHDDEPCHDAQGLRPAPVSHQHHPLSQGSG